RVLDLGPTPRQAVTGQVERAAEGRVHGERVEAGALVVQDAVDRVVAAARPAADLVGGLQDLDLDPGLREGEGGSESVRPAADHHRRRHVVTFSSPGTSPAGRYPGRCHVTVCFTPFGIHGC